MVKKKLYNPFPGGRRKVPERASKNSHPYATPPPFLEQVDALLNQKDLDEQLNERRSKERATAPRRGQPKEDSNYPTDDETTEERRSPGSVGQNYDDDDDNAGAGNYSSDAELENMNSPVEKRPSKTKNSQQVTSVSSTDSTGSPTNDMRVNKDKRRVSEASSRNLGTTTSKTVLDYKDRLARAQKNNAAKDQRLQEMTAKLRAIEKKTEQLELRDRQTTAALAYARENPEALIPTNSTKGNKKRASSEKSDDLTDEEDDEDNEEDDDSDEDASVVEKVKAKRDKDMVQFGNSAVISVFRTKKFISTNEQQAKFLEAVLDKLGKSELIHKPGHSDAQKGLVTKMRKKYMKKWAKSWISYLNNYRNYTQQRSKDATMAWMEETGRTTLPDPALLRRHILTRDFSIYEPKEGDTEDELTKKAAGMALLEDLMDYYTEKLMPACAGAKLFNTKIRHFDAMSEVLMPNGGEGQLRITAGTEAFAMLTYMNNKDKWEATFDWHFRNPNTTTKCPRYSKTKPTENVKFKAKYSDSQTGTPHWGGWSEEGRKLFGVLQREVLASREANMERHIQRDKECVERLHYKYAELHKNDHRQPKKAKITNEDERVYDEDLEYVDEE